MVCLSECGQCSECAGTARSPMDAHREALQPFLVPPLRAEPVGDGKPGLVPPLGAVQGGGGACVMPPPGNCADEVGGTSSVQVLNPNGGPFTDGQCRVGCPTTAPELEGWPFQEMLLEVTCEGFAPKRVGLLIRDPVSPPAGGIVGTVLVGTGGLGDTYYECLGVGRGREHGGGKVIRRLLDHGFRVVQRAWENGWFGECEAPPSCSPGAYPRRAQGLRSRYHRPASFGSRAATPRSSTTWSTRCP